VALNLTLRFLCGLLSKFCIFVVGNNNELHIEAPLSKKTVKKLKSGGSVQQYSSVDTSASDYANILNVCIEEAKKGKQVLIAPRFDRTIGNVQYETIYKNLRGTKYWGQCPDYSVDDLWWEHEGFDRTKDLSNPKTVKTTFKNMLSRGIKQSNRIVLEDCGMPDYLMKHLIRMRVFRDHHDIKEVYIRTQTGLKLVYKTTTAD
jgi:hypothetical protein